LRIYDKNTAVGHVERPLDLAAKVSMAGRVDDVDPVIVVLDGRNLGGDGNSPLLLLVAAVHDQVLAHFGLVVAEGLRLLEQAVDQRRLAVVNVGDNGDIADLGRVLDLHDIKKAPKVSARLSYL
jgi:hypothetical protein